MNQKDIADAIEAGIKDVASYQAALAQNLATLANKGADSFVVYVDDFVPVQGTKHEPHVRQDAAHLFATWEKWTRKLMGSTKFEDAAVRNPSMLSESFSSFVETFTEQKMVAYQRDFNRAMADRVAKEWQHGDHDSFRGQVQAQAFADEKKAILQTLDAELADIEQRHGKQFPLKRGKK